MYLAMMAGDGLTRATEIAILSANYVSKRLEQDYPTFYRGANGLVAHECILNLQDLKGEAGIEVEDVAKRLMDYGFHAPTVSWPVAGTLMVEPTESETKAEIDRFCTAMLAIRDEIRAVEQGDISAEDSPLRHAPHTVDDLVGDWPRSYPRSVGRPRGSSYQAPVGRIDAAYGDRNLVCTCEPLESYASSR